MAIDRAFFRVIKDVPIRQHGQGERLPSSHHHSKSSSCLKCGLRRHSDRYKIDKHDKGPRGVKFLNLVNTHFTAALDFDNYCLQKQSEAYNSRISDKLAK